MRSLFGPQCSTANFRHDLEMRELLVERELRSQQTQTTSSPVSPEQRFHPKRSISEPTVVRRNVQGRLRRFDADGREVDLEDITDENLRHKVNQLQAIYPNITLMMCRNALLACKGSVEDATALLSSPAYEPMHAPVINLVDNEVPTATPARNISAVSPNSESQNLRRKAILEGVAAGSAKRIRLQYDGSDSSLIPGFAKASQPSYQPGLDLPEYSDSFDDVDTPGSEVDSDQNTTVVPAIPPYSAFHDETGREISYDFDELVPR
jgi:hypothetical protein